VKSDGLLLYSCLPVAEAGDRPPQCPWCGDGRTRDIGPTPDGERCFRCESCLKTFFIRAGTPPVEPK
jgi:transposase-like protein